MTYIEQKLKEFDDRFGVSKDYAYFVPEYDDEARDKNGNEVKTFITQVLTEAYNQGRSDYRNHIVGVIAENKQDYKLYDGDIITAITMPKIREVLSLLQDTNPKE